MNSWHLSEHTTENVAAKISCSLSVVVATRNRARQLERMLTSMGRQTLDRGEVTVIVVVNGSNDNTQEVVDRKSKELNLIVLSEGIAGKSRALNRALNHVDGDLAVFTDDDVTAPPSWLRAYHNAALKFPSANVFCGPVVPEFPVETPQWLRSHPTGGIFFARFEPGVPEGPLPGTLTDSEFPSGANFAVRMSALETVRFKDDLGPSEENGALYGEDTEFLGRLYSRFGEFIFVPEAKVMHHLEPSRIQWPTLFEKAFNFGRTEAIRSGSPVSPPQPIEFPFREQDIPAIERFDKGCLLNFLCGQLCEFRLRGRKEFETILEDMLRPLDIYTNRALLSTSAQKMVIDTPSGNAGS